MHTGEHMRQYAHQFVSENDYSQFITIREVMKIYWLKQDELTQPISCHILALAISKVFSIQSEHGYFYPNFLHSWCVSLEGQHIIDVYPVCMLCEVILIPRKPEIRLPGDILFIQDHDVDIDIDLFDLDKIVLHLTSIKETLRKVK